MKEVTKEEYIGYLKARPLLLRHAMLSHEPPLVCWIEDGKPWPESIVATEMEEIDSEYKKTGAIIYKVSI